MKILLISPAHGKDVLHLMMRDLTFLPADAFFAPHACAVVAALTPAEHEVQIHDECVHGPVDEVMVAGGYDVVGISLVPNAFLRATAIAELFRERCRTGVLVAGGAPMMHMWSRLKGLLDAAFIGEAEETWPAFLVDLEQGRHARLYRQIAKPSMDDCPVPRWDLIGADLARYSLAPVQTVRGCPYDCTFCDVIYTYGRKLRFKPIDQVLKEVALLESFGVSTIYFADDNFAANGKHAKALLRRLTELNRSFECRIGFATQADITIAEDDELLQLMLDANMIEVQIGIESIHEDSLRDIDKVHNLRPDDMVEAIKRIQSYGIVVLAHMIVGMDSDDRSTFDSTEQFLRDANVVHQALHPLMAPPGTKLWYHLQREGRLVEVSDEMHDKLDLYTNVVPLGMSRLELIEGVADYRMRVSDPDHFFERAMRFVAGVTHRPSQPVTNQPSPWRMRKMLFGMLKHFLFRASRGERRIFFKLLGKTGRGNPALIPTVSYAHICHLMERAYAEVSVRWARGIAAEERALPDGPPTLSRKVLISDAIHRSFKEIVAVAYRCVRAKVAERNTLYQVVVEAVMDYADRQGETLGEFDDYERDAVEKSCERVLAKVPSTAASAERGSLPEAGAPPGFVREILDAMDQTMRYEVGSAGSAS